MVQKCAGSQIHNTNKVILLCGLAIPRSLLKTHQKKCDECKGLVLPETTKSHMIRRKEKKRQGLVSSSTEIYKYYDTDNLSFENGYHITS